MWRAVGFAADVAAPDITAGMTTVMKMPEELGVAITDTGEVIDVQAVPAKPQITLDQLLEQFDAESIMTANGGKIPATQEEVEMVFAILKGA